MAKWLKEKVKNIKKKLGKKAKKKKAYCILNEVVSPLHQSEFAGIA